MGRDDALAVAVLVACAALTAGALVVIGALLVLRSVVDRVGDRRG